MIYYKAIQYSLVLGFAILAWWFTSITAVLILGCALGVAWYFRDLAVIQVLPEHGEHVLDVGSVAASAPHGEFATRESQKITMPWDAVVIDDPDARRHFGAALHAWRVGRRMALRQLADEISMSIVRLDGIESGLVPPDIQEIAALFDCGFDYEMSGAKVA